MQETVNAVYQNGLLRPLRPLRGIPENATVKVIVELEEHKPFADWVGGVSDEDAARMRQVIEEEFERIDFERIDPDEWK